MRLFSFLLATALVAALNAHLVVEDLGTSYKFPAGLPDGIVITFFFYHRHHATLDGNEPTFIYFYDQDVVTPKEYETRDVNAYLKMVSDADQPLISDTYVDGAWRRYERFWQWSDTRPAWTSWWRVDVVKLDNYRLNVFCEGYWSGVRTFKLPLDNVKSAYILSEHVNPYEIQIHVKYPNDNLVLLSYDQFMDHINVKRPDFTTVDRKLVTMNGLPVGSRIELSTLMMTNGDKKAYPYLMFKEPNSNEDDHLIMIGQWWIWDISGDLWQETWTHQLGISSMFNERIPCTEPRTRPNGDVVHFALTRTERYKVKLDVFYKNLDHTTYTCEMVTTYESYAKSLDLPFQIWSHAGALIFHIEYFPPDSEAKNNNNSTRV